MPVPGSFLSEGCTTVLTNIRSLSRVDQLVVIQGLGRGKSLGALFTFILLNMLFVRYSLVSIQHFPVHINSLALGAREDSLSLVHALVVLVVFILEKLNLTQATRMMFTHMGAHLALMAEFALASLALYNFAQD